MLLDGFGSGWLALAVAVSVYCPFPLDAVALMVICSEPFDARFPSAQLTLEKELVHTGAPGATDLTVKPVGRVSDIVTLVASDGPLFVTVT